MISLQAALARCEAQARVQRVGQGAVLANRTAAGRPGSAGQALVSAAKARAGTTAAATTTPAAATMVAAASTPAAAMAATATPGREEQPAAAQAEGQNQGNQQCDSTKHQQVLMLKVPAPLAELAL